MGGFAALYAPSLALLTDLYELTMAFGYWKSGLHRAQAVFHLHFRNNPFGGGYALACGLESVVDYLRRWRFDDQDRAYLSGLTGADGRPLFDGAFLDYLGQMRFACDVDAVQEGTVVFPHEPLVRVRGPLLQAQIIETALLTLVNFQTLIATKAARVTQAAGGDPVLEFGLRRAQGIDGGLSASRAAYIGGCAATSNVLAGRLFDIPVKGTHAHSWVMCFDDELQALDAYARAMPNNCVFLVDTYDTLQGVRNAVEVGRRLRAAGHEMLGVRLDSGDLVELSIAARKILDEAGFPNAAVVASNDLDEHLIKGLKEQGAKIGVWGVGTRLATAYDQPALGGVYKLSAICFSGGDWQDRVKLSEQAIKTSTPGVLQTRRFQRHGRPIGDAIFDQRRPPPEACVIADPTDSTRRTSIPPGTPGDDLLVPVFRGGECVYEAPSIHEVRRRAAAQLASFDDGVKRFDNAQPYTVGLESGLFERKNELIAEAQRHS